MQPQYDFTTQDEVRKAFWQGLHKKPPTTWTQENYSALIRSEWIEFIEMLESGGHISHELADSITLVFCHKHNIEEFRARPIYGV